MQHYQFHIGDYIKDTAHLTDAEDLAYRRLLDLYYTLEGPLPIDVKPLCRRARIAQDVAEQILSEFFIKTADGFHHSRCDRELERIYAKSEKARASAKFSVEVRKSNYAKRAERLYDAKAKGTHTSIEWAALKEACGSKCVKCGADEPLTKDHIQPIYQGGSDGLDNIQPLCKSCNSAKGPENIDYRPSGWVAFVERTLSERSANVMLPVTHDPLPVNPEPVTQDPKPRSQKPEANQTESKPLQPAAPAAPKKKVADVESLELQAVCRETWGRYSEAYAVRYGTPPVRNAKISGQIKQFCRRVPAIEAPAIAAFYVAHNNAFYVTKGHAVGQLLADAEKLRTEWATNQTITVTQARQTDQTQANGNIFGKLIAEAKERERNGTIQQAT